MDRDPQENVVDAEDRTTPSTGNSDFGEAGDERARKAEDKSPDERDDRAERAGGAEPTVIPPPD